MRPAPVRDGTFLLVHTVWFVRLVSWSGALAFVLSLGYGLRAYVVDFSEVAPPGAPWGGAAAVNVLLFSVFALHHSVMARTGVKRLVVAATGEALERPAYVWLSSLLFLLCCLAWQPLPGVLYAWPAGWTAVPVAVQVAGAIVTAIAARRLDVFALAGLRPSRDVSHQPLETTGLYGWVRHPIYFGWILLVLGAPVMTATRAAFAAISIAYLVAAVPFEERGLVSHYGDTYRAYQRRVRARLVPGVY